MQAIGPDSTLLMKHHRSFIDSLIHSFVHLFIFSKKQKKNYLFIFFFFKSFLWFQLACSTGFYVTYG
ncbi:hypothetical protein ACKS0A_09819 [Histoplasma ohiense]